MRKVTKYEIIEKVARARMAEVFIAKICRKMEGRPELDDFAQIIYLALLQKPDETIQKAYAEGWLPFLVRAMVVRQYNTSHSTFRDLFTKYGRRAVDIGVLMMSEDGGDDTQEQEGGTATG